MLFKPKELGFIPSNVCEKKNKSIILLFLFHFLLDWMLVRYKGPGCGEGGQGGPHIPSPLPCSPSFHLFFLGFLPLALFRLQNIEHCCIVPFPTTSPSYHTLLVHPPSFPFLSSLPYQSGPLLSQTVPPLFSPTALYEITRITTVNYAPLDEMLV